MKTNFILNVIAAFKTKNTFQRSIGTFEFHKAIWRRRSIDFLILITAGIVFISCEKMLLKEDSENTPSKVFQAFTGDFRNLYGAFDAKNLDWDLLTKEYSEKVHDDMNSADLYEVLTEMLDVLNDGHADIMSIEHGHFRSWNRRGKPYFKGREGTNLNDVISMQNVIRTEYLKNQFKSGSYSGWLFFYGMIEYNEKKLGYICIPTFNIGDFPNAFIQEAIDEFMELDGVIIDLRFNGGGRTEAFVSLHNRFGSVEKMYLKSRFRNGLGLNDFTPIAEHWVRPHATSLKNKPIAILTNAYTASSSDHFVVAMKTQPDVICVGDTTYGAFSAVFERILPNGWKYRLGAQVVYDTDGSYLQDQNGNYLEGIGIAPDFYVEDDWNHVLQKKDAVLDKALLEITSN
jgi:hypothetical protein